MRKPLLLLILLVASALAIPAEDKQAKPDAQYAALQAEVESLKAQLAQVKLEYAYSMQICTAPDLMAVRLAAVEAARKAAAVKAEKPATKVVP